MELGKSVKNKVYNSLSVSVWGSVYWVVKDSVSVPVYDSVSDSVWFSVNNSTRNEIR